MVVIGHQQLQRVLAWRKFDDRLGLATTEMLVVVIRWQWLARRRLVGQIDQQMMVPGVGALDTRRRHTHAGQAEFDCHRTAHLRPICRFDDVDLRIRRCRRTRQCRSSKAQNTAGQHRFRYRTHNTPPCSGDACRRRHDPLTAGKSTLPVLRVLGLETTQSAYTSAHRQSIHLLPCILDERLKPTPRGTN